MKTTTSPVLIPFAIGSRTLFGNRSGDDNTVLGNLAGTAVTTANNVICIGSGVGGANLSNSCYIGSIFGQTSSGGSAVFINANGKLHAFPLRQFDPF